MSLIIELTPSEEAQISAAAKQTGMAPSEWVKKLVEANLSASPAGQGDNPDTGNIKQEQAGAAPGPDVATRNLFARWDVEDSQLSEEQQKQNERVYGEIEKNGIPRTRI